MLKFFHCIVELKFAGWCSSIEA